MGCESFKPCFCLLFWLGLLTFAGAQDQTPHFCLTNGNYTRNSTYATNLNTLLDSLASNMTDNGFYNASAGQNLDRVNAIVLCISDQTLDQCRSCVGTAAVRVLQLCPNQRQAVIWYGSCMLRYSNEPILGTPASEPSIGLRNTADALNSNNRFVEDRKRLLDDVCAEATRGGSDLKAGAGSRNTSDYQTIYALVQCTPDLSPEDCNSCLVGAIQPTLGGRSQGMRQLMPSCNIRYELYPFYNETRLSQLGVLLPPAPIPSPPGTPDDNGRGKKDDNTTIIIIVVVVAVVVCIVLAACCFIFLIKRKKQRPYEIAEATDDISTVESLQYDFGKIRAATDDFADTNKLGQGGFGAVYSVISNIVDDRANTILISSVNFSMFSIQGRLINGQEIAVKRLSMSSGQGNHEFKNEVLLLARLQHRNLVRLLGFSIQGSERLLIYEYVQNASLDQFIFDPMKSSTLDWSRRFKIIGGIAKGLQYLHEDSRLRIIHRDLKASNILLDGEMNPKIADFGMARLFGQDEASWQGNTSRIVGTYGYMSPEYAMHGQFSVKSDIFSFGVLVLEIMTGQRNSCLQNGENVEDLLGSTWKNWREGTTTNTIDPVLRAGTDSMQDMLRCIHIGLLCVQENPVNRPTMPSIALMLNSSTVTLPVPSEPAFFMASSFGPRTNFKDSKELNLSTESNINAGISVGSCQDVSITELYPR